MYLKKLLKLGVICVIVISSVAMVGNVLAQEPDNETEGIQEPAELPNIEGFDVSALAEPPRTLSYQGFLTDPSGEPLTATVTLSFSLYTDATPFVGEEIQWGPEIHENVQVSNGVFNVLLGETEPLGVGLFPEKALYLAISVDGVTLVPRQALRPVPVAFSMPAGSRIRGDNPNSTFGLTVFNDGNRFSANGLYRQSGILAVGFGFAIYADENSASGDVAIYSADFVDALGYRSRAPSYWWTSGLEGVPATPGNTTVNNLVDGVSVQATSIGARTFYVPLDVPSYLYGQNVSLNELTITYNTSNAASGISQTTLYKQTISGTETILIDSTRYTSTTTMDYTLTISPSGVLSQTHGPLGVQLILDFANITDSIKIQRVGVELGHGGVFTPLN